MAGSQKIECGPQRSARATMSVATQCLTDQLRISAMLDSDAESDRGIPGVRVGRGIGFVIAEKQLADRATLIPTNGAGIAKPRNLDLKSLVCSPVRQSLAYGHGPVLYSGLASRNLF